MAEEGEGEEAEGIVVELLDACGCADVDGAGFEEYALEAVGASAFVPHGDHCSAGRGVVDFLGWAAGLGVVGLGLPSRTTTDVLLL